MSSPTNISVDADGINVNATMYRGMIGSLFYLILSHPDIMFSTSMCARYQANPKELHLKAVKCIFRFLKHSPDPGLWYSHDSPFKLVGFIESDYASCSLD